MYFYVAILVFHALVLVANMITFGSVTIVWVLYFQYAYIWVLLIMISKVM